MYIVDSNNKEIKEYNLDDNLDNIQELTGLDLFIYNVGLQFLHDMRIVLPIYLVILLIIFNPVLGLIFLLVALLIFII